jgi:hypothetical protein
VGIGTDAFEIDGEGGYVLPGVIDAYIRLHSKETLAQLCKWGVITGLNMACSFPTMLISLRNQKDVTDIRCAGDLAASPGSMQSLMPRFPKEGLLEGSEGASKFVDHRMNEGAD